MRHALYCAIVPLLALSFHVTAKEPADAAKKLLNDAVSDVRDWEEVAKGLYRGISTDGSIVRAFVGAEGAKIELAANEDEIHAVSQELESLLGSKGHGSDVKLASLERRFEMLQRQNDWLRQSISDAPPANAAKADQLFIDTHTVCGSSINAFSHYYATPDGTGGYTGIVANGGWYRVNAVVPAPPPPAPPYWVERYTQMSVLYSGSPTWQDDAMTTDQSVHQSVTVNYPYPMDSNCGMRSWQSTRYRCVSTSPIVTFGLRRDQTCAGVVSNSAPPVLITW